MLLIPNSIQIDKVDAGFRVSYSTDDGQVATSFETFAAVASYLVDNGFAPVPTT